MKKKKSNFGVIVRLPDFRLPIKMLGIGNIGKIAGRVARQEVRKGVSAFDQPGGDTNTRGHLTDNRKAFVKATEGSYMGIINVYKFVSKKRGTGKRKRKGEGEVITSVMERPETTPKERKGVSLTLVEKRAGGEKVAEKQTFSITVPRKRGAAPEVAPEGGKVRVTPPTFEEEPEEEIPTSEEMGEMEGEEETLPPRPPRAPVQKRVRKPKKATSPKMTGEGRPTKREPAKISESWTSTMNALFREQKEGERHNKFLPRPEVIGDLVSGGYTPYEDTQAGRTAAIEDYKSGRYRIALGTVNGKRVMGRKEWRKFMRVKLKRLKRRGRR
jgi:hypothetical protein